MSEHTITLKQLKNIFKKKQYYLKSKDTRTESSRHIKMYGREDIYTFKIKNKICKIINNYKFTQYKKGCSYEYSNNIDTNFKILNCDTTYFIEKLLN